MENTDIPAEPAPKDQAWVHYPEFEKSLYKEIKHAIPVQAITKGPGYHWFGYYDKFQTDPSDRYVLSMQTEFDFRSPSPADSIKLGFIDLKDGNRWIEIGSTTAWGWQQGCMLQWRPDSDSEIMWNDRVDKKFVTCIYDIHSQKKRTLPHAFYHVHPSGKFALGADFARIQDMRPGYGYAGVPDKNRRILRPEDSGIYSIDLDTGEYKFLFSVAEIASISYEGENKTDDKHYFNHVAFNSTGSRFVFLNRWKSYSRRWPDFRTRMFTANFDGSNIRLVTDDESISHFVWKDADHLLLWAAGAFRLYTDDGSGKSEVVLLATNGHQSYLPDQDWILSDTYRDVHGNQNLYLYHVASRRVIPIARFFEPSEYINEWRCDLHPRISRNGKMLIIDSTHILDQGRQMYALDISGLEDFKVKT